MASKYINHVERCLDLTNQGKSKITEDILNIVGMTGVLTRHFYNNICSIDGCRYLEIGTWLGSSFCAAMCNNNMKCVAIDNWSEFREFNFRGFVIQDSKAEFLKNYENFKGENDAKFIEDDSFNVKLDEKFNIYMYDGNHSKHYEALAYFLDNMDDEFIYLIDYWNWDIVRTPTLNAISALNLEILYKKEIFTPECFEADSCKFKRDGDHCDFRDWANGIGIFVLKKN